MQQVGDNVRLLGAAMSGLLEATLLLGRSVFAWAFGRHRVTATIVLTVFSLALLCALHDGCLNYVADLGALATQAGSTATAGVLAWSAIQLQDAAARFPALPALTRPTTGGAALTRPIGVANGPLRPFWETCMLSAVVNGLYDLASSAFNYQSGGTANAGLDWIF